MFRYSTFDPSDPANSGELFNSNVPVGDVLSSFSNLMSSLGSLTRWKEITDSDPTPEPLREYASSYTPGTNSGSLQTQFIRFYLADDPGLELDPVRCRMMTISKYNSTATNRRLIVSVRDLGGSGEAWSFTGTTNSSSYYFIYSESQRVYLIETDNCLCFITRSVNSDSFRSYNLVTYLDPPIGSNVSRSSIYAPHITISNRNDQANTNSNLPSNSYIEARLGVSGYITPVLPIFPDFGANDNILIGRAQLVRSGSDGFYMGELDDVLCCARTIGNEIDIYTIEGRRYIRGVHYNTSSMSNSEHSLVLLFPVEP